MMTDQFYVRLSQVEIIDRKTQKVMAKIDRLSGDCVSINLPEGMPGSTDEWLELAKRVKSATNMFMDR